MDSPQGLVVPQTEKLAPLSGPQVLVVAMGVLFLAALFFVLTFRTRVYLQTLRERFPPGTTMAPLLASDTIAIWSLRTAGLGALVMLILILGAVVFFPIQ